ncbi:hypothetical protein AGMMS49965_17750 [Bacteroidia bacterium]|nr:hypothetical protein AGMMS49965_17750 [Bacteroidia bacterium]
MEIILGKFATTYLLMPLLGIFFTGVLFLIAQKNRLLRDKKVIFYFLGWCILLATPALLGFLGYSFFYVIYIWLTVLYFCLGFVLANGFSSIFPACAGKGYWVELLTLVVLLFLSAALFSVVFNLCSELKYGVWASSCLVAGIVPSLFLKAVRSYLAIPPAIHAVWSYDAEMGELEAETLDSDKIIVVEMELFKQPADTELLNIKAKTAENAPFGVWFKLFVKHYNIRSPLQPIACEADGQSFGWIFYTQSIWGGKRHIDPTQSFAQNKIRDNDIIFAKRVMPGEGRKS